MAEPLTFVANLAQRQSSLMLSGQGDRLLVELEAFNLDAVRALVGLAQYTGRSFRVTVEEIELEQTREHETTAGAEAEVIRVGRGRSRNRGD